MKIMQFFLLNLLFVFTSCSKSDNQESTPAANSKEQLIYLVMTSQGNILIDDSRTLERNKSIIGLADTNLNYSNYVERVKQMLKIRKKYKEDEYFYEIDYGKDLEILTNLKPGDEFYLSLHDEVKKAFVSFYIVDLDAEIGGGPVFYPVLKLEDKSTLDEGIYVASTTPDISSTNEQLKSDDYPEIVSSMLEKFKGIEIEVWSEAGESNLQPLKSFGEDEIFIIKNKLNDNFIVSVLKRKSFDMFISGSYEVTKNGEIISEIIPQSGGDFYYQFISGVYLIGKDSEQEFIFQEGYYEGVGYGIMKKTQEGFKNILSGFFFGV